MKKKHIAVFTPLATGHVYPALGLCSELVRRGHRVTFPTDGRLAGRIREAGAEPIDVKMPKIMYAEKVSEQSGSSDSHFWRYFASVYSPMLLVTAATMAAELEEFYIANRPDVVLYEWFSFAGRILAKRLDCPAIQICSHFAHRDYLIRLDGVPTNPPAMVGFGRLLDSLMSTYGFAGGNHFWHVENLNIFFLPREFQYEPELFDHRYKFVGATHNRQPSCAVPWRNHTANGKPIILISENSASRDDRFLKLCIQAFGGSQYHVVFSKGLNSPELCSTLLPGNIEINREVFNRDILPFVNVMLCQGGMGTTLEALYHGVPVVAVPPNPFNSEVAYRVVEMGIGLHLPERDVAATALRKAVDAVFSDTAIQRRVRQLQGSWQCAPGAEASAAADAVEEYTYHLTRR